ncbi:MAG: hypothetical protein LBC20_13215 [Planctomycetaceae bacterium]|nr:hypothetical protein [Planctomycetaceae bacterium]
MLSWQRITVVSKKPYKIRRRTMEIVLKFLVVFLGTFLAKIPPLKWVSQEKQGGGGTL